MVESKSKDDKSKEADRLAAKSFDATKSIFEIANENYARIIDEAIKIQPQYSRAISNLQSDYIQTIKNIIEATFQAQKHLVGTNAFNWSNIPSTLYLQQSEALANNMIRTLATNNQLAINVLEAARNSIETSNNVVNSVTEVNTNVVSSWNSLFSRQQQRFFK
jgi:galactokinase